MKIYHHIAALIIIACTAIISFSCANRGQGPQGGPKDTIPPSVAKSFPSNKALNVQKSKIVITFDENVILQKVSEKVIISPPQVTAPNIQALGRSVIVELNDTLKQNTTYSINFGDAIVDNNESNALKNYVFAFSTGNTIDTLQISGTLINSENLNPLKGITVGIYNADLPDSTFMKYPFLRITKTDEKGKFTIPNIKEGNYKVRALKDDSRDNVFQSGEGIAFNNVSYSPTVESYLRNDTVWKDSINIDTVKIVKAYRYLPDNVLLKYFNENKGKKQRFIKFERKERNHFTLFFNAPAEELPTFEPFNVQWENNFLLQKNATLDTLTYWITDKNLIEKDTISLKMKYLKTDSLNHLSYSTDTLNVVFRRTKNNTTQAKQPDGKEKKIEHLILKNNLTTNFDVYNPILLSFDVPIKSIDSTKLRMFQMKDTIPIPIKFKLIKQDEIGMKYTINYAWQPEKTYLLEIDSAAIVSIYDLHTNKYKGDLKIKSLDEYSSLKLMLEKFNPEIVFQAVNSKDEVVRSASATEKGAYIKYLQPGDYYVRMFMDKNRNGKWDTGNFLENKQPEDVYYYPKKLTLIKNWEIEETIDYERVPLLEQKPKEIIKTDQKEGGN